MTRFYYWHTDYDNYPVSGVSWSQTKEYCKWKSDLFNEVSEELSLNFKLEFRLPNEAEWELAARQLQFLKNGQRITNRSLYPWSGAVFMQDGNYLANFGQIHDENGIVVKEYSSDGAQYNSEVGFYPPNFKGVYDMAGSVSEWVDLVPGFNFDLEIEKQSERCYEDVYKRDDYDVRICEDEVKHNKAIATGPNKGLVKGGSWADGLAYIQIGSRQIMDKDKSSCKVGFRVAVSDPGKKYRKYFPKKNWTPK